MEKVPKNEDRSRDELVREAYSSEPVKGEGFVLNRKVSAFGGGTNLTKLEFREGETTESAGKRQRVEKEYREKDRVKHYLKIGDWIQWESQGSNQFDSPKKVAKISEDRNFVFVEGSDVGIPIEQVSFEYPLSESDI